MLIPFLPTRPPEILLPLGASPLGAWNLAGGKLAFANVQTR
jgi:hypothetical protein